MRQGAYHGVLVHCALIFQHGTRRDQVLHPRHLHPHRCLRRSGTFAPAGLGKLWYCPPHG